MDGGRSRYNIFTAGQSSLMGWLERPWSLGFPAFRIGIMTEFFQNAGMSTPTTERMKSSVRNAHQDGRGGARWARQAPVLWKSLSIPYDRSNAFLVERPVSGVYTMVTVEVPHEPSECPIVLGRTGSKLPVEGLCNRLRAGVGFSLECDWDIWWGTPPLAAQLVQEGQVTLGVGGAVGGL